MPKNNMPNDLDNVVELKPEHSWHRQPRETDEAFEAFVSYRDMGLKRSISKVSAQLAKGVRQIERWSAHHAWRKRVLDFENEQDRIRIAAHTENVQEMSARHSKLALKLFAKVAKRLDALDVDELDTKDLINYARICVSMERQARGADTMLKRRRSQFDL
jgi:arginine utilization protein RocB